MSAHAAARGARCPVPSSPWSGRSTSIRSVASPWSRMVNCGGSENDSACCRMILCAMAWKVPPQIRSTPPDEPSKHAAARASMSLAARRVKVRSRIRLARHALAAAQPRRPRHQRPGLAGARPGQHQQRPALLRGRPPLLLVQPVKYRALIEHAYEHNQPGRRGPVRRARPRLSRRGPGHPMLVTGSDSDPGPQPSRTDKRWYFALMATCIGLFVLVLGGHRPVLHARGRDRLGGGPGRSAVRGDRREHGPAPPTAAPVDHCREYGQFSVSASRARLRRPRRACRQRQR